MIEPKSPQFLEYYAKVCEREANCRSGDFADWLRGCASRAREQAQLASIPVQADLFGGAA